MGRQKLHSRQARSGSKRSEHRELELSNKKQWAEIQNTFVLWSVPGGLPQDVVEAASPEQLKLLSGALVPSLERTKLHGQGQQGSRPNKSILS